jgi:hypothetical protein
LQSRVSSNHQSRHIIDSFASSTRVSRTQYIISRVKHYFNQWTDAKEGDLCFISSSWNVCRFPPIIRDHKELMSKGIHIHTNRRMDGWYYGSQSVVCKFTNQQESLIELGAVFIQIFQIRALIELLGILKCAPCMCSIIHFFVISQFVIL